MPRYDLYMKQTNKKKKAKEQFVNQDRIGWIEYQPFNGPKGAYVFWPAKKKELPFVGSKRQCLIELHNALEVYFK